MHHTHWPCIIQCHAITVGAGQAPPPAFGTLSLDLSTPRHGPFGLAWVISVETLEHGLAARYIVGDGEGAKSNQSQPLRTHASDHHVICPSRNMRTDQVRRIAFRGHHGPLVSSQHLFPSSHHHAPLEIYSAPCAFTHPESHTRSTPRPRNLNCEVVRIRQEGIHVQRTLGEHKAV